jgi:hypothetical protein
MRKLSPEFRLAAACCRWPPSAERDQNVRNRARQVDWPRLLRIARRQRVEALVNDALRRAGVDHPALAVSALGSASIEIAQQNLLFAVESRRLHELLDQAEVPHLFLKGATLDMLAYGSLALKRGRDIDILVDPDAALRASELLAGAGYGRIIPGPEIGPAQFEQWIALCKESSWRHSTSGLIVELHTALVDNPDLLAGIGLGSTRQTVPVAPGINLPTLGAGELYAYLCVHGATHAWSRLKWISDVGAYLARPGTDIERLHTECERIGAGRASAQALLLCFDLFGTAVPTSLRNRLEGDRVNRWLVDLALGTMAGRYAETELDDTVLGTLSIHLSHFALGAGWKFKLRELSSKLNNRDDRMQYALPRPLYFLYPIMSLPSWVWRRLHGAGRS